LRYFSNATLNKKGQNDPLNRSAPLLHVSTKRRRAAALQSFAMVGPALLGSAPLLQRRPPAVGDGPDEGLLMIQQCGLTPQNLWLPKPDGRKPIQVIK
jgi:hypothetical protein